MPDIFDMKILLHKLRVILRGLEQESNLCFCWSNFSAIVYIVVRIHVMFDFMNQNITFFSWIWLSMNWNHTCRFSESLNNSLLKEWKEGERHSFYARKKAWFLFWIEISASGVANHYPHLRRFIDAFYCEKLSELIS